MLVEAKSSIREGKCSHQPSERDTVMQPRGAISCFRGPLGFQSEIDRGEFRRRAKLVPARNVFAISFSFAYFRHGIRERYYTLRTRGHTFDVLKLKHGTQLRSSVSRGSCATLTRVTHSYRVFAFRRPARPSWIKHAESQLKTVRTVRRNCEIKSLLRGWRSANCFVRRRIFTTGEKRW